MISTTIQIVMIIFNSVGIIAIIVGGFRAYKRKDLFLYALCMSVALISFIMGLYWNIGVYQITVEHNIAIAEIRAGN
jgi:hypothetical protein